MIKSTFDLEVPVDLAYIKQMAIEEIEDFRSRNNSYFPLVFFLSSQFYSTFKKLAEQDTSLEFTKKEKDVLYVKIQEHIYIPVCEMECNYCPQSYNMMISLPFTPEFHSTKALIEKERILQLYHKAKRIYFEDECAPDGEVIQQAWLRLFGEKFDTWNAINEEDWGDCRVYEFPNNRIACIGPSKSGFTEIRVLDDKS